MHACKLHVLTYKVQAHQQTLADWCVVLSLSEGAAFHLRLVLKLELHAAFLSLVQYKLA